MRTKKCLSQNFLKSEPALRAIIKAGELKKGGVVLEIGPGKGALTEKILEVTNRVIAVEKDAELFAMLSEKFRSAIAEGKLSLVEGDILDFDIDTIIGKNAYKIIANIPYNITGAILKKFLMAQHQPESMVLMVQHEVAKRILGRETNSTKIRESILSISVKTYGEPKIVMKVPARYFSPSPKVDSAVIAIKNISRKNFMPGEKSKKVISEEKFWEIIHAGFAHKRKKLSGNLKNIFFGKPELLNGLANKRAEELSVDQWLELASL